jgi:hypothetical protein
MANLNATTIGGDLTISAPGTVLGSGAGLTALNASNVASGTLATDRLPTVPTAKGGTGLTSLGTAGQVLTVSSPGTAVSFADAAGGGIGNAALAVNTTSPGTFSGAADTQFIVVTAVGGGGGGGVGSAMDMPGYGSGPQQNGTAGTATNFGTLLSANGGSGGLRSGQDGQGQGGAGGGKYTSGQVGVFFSVAGTEGQTQPDNGGGTAEYIAFSGNGNGGNGGPSGNGGGAGGGGGSGAVTIGMFAAAQYTPGIPYTIGSGGNTGTLGHPPVQRAGQGGQTGKITIQEYKA